MGGGDSLERQKTRPRSVDQIGHHARSRRGDGRGQSRDARSTLVGCGYSDDWSVPATEQEAHAHRALLHDGRVRRTARVWKRNRIQMGGVESAGEVVVSRRGAGPRAKRGASEVVWRNDSEQ